ncbi:E3 ubiquitin-protein ligase TRIM65 isoform X2 [Peromyscus eremicus]|uniref:E3 ubiquitin-protein ligase TRIM65 isoform X2 n=1 Tax=Peromyscus eremicus TaxID=42410 RepID=UPI0027DCBF2C|nr:E3 ubiquitin-protein ligase TRIM65 isoform X2 [Peromyscus eremicus]
MAAQLVEDQVTCSICLDRYRDPVTLPCGHSFCGGCMQDSWRCWEKTCPECRQPFPEGAKLCRSVTLSTLLQTLPLDLQAQAAAIPRPEPGAGHSARCPRHGRPLEFFCLTDGLCVCSACTVHECRLHERALLDVERRVREDQLKARAAVARQQVTQAETQLQELRQQSSQIQSSACTLTSVVSSRFSSLLQALEKLRALTLRNIEVAKKRALDQALSEIQRLTDHLEVLSQYDHSVQDLLGQVDDSIFFQELQQLSEPVESPGPLTAPQWDEEQQLNSVNEMLGPLCELLLEEKPPRVAGKAGPVDYRNLTFDPDSANQYLYLSHKDQQVTHHFQAQGPARPGSFELWQGSKGDRELLYGEQRDHLDTSLRSLLNLEAPSPLQSQACLYSAQTPTAWPPNHGAGGCCGSASQPRLELGKRFTVMIKSHCGDQRMELIMRFPAKPGPPRLSPTRLLLSRRPFPTPSPSAWLLAAWDHPSSGATSTVLPSPDCPGSQASVCFSFDTCYLPKGGNLTTGMCVCPFRVYFLEF